VPAGLTCARTLAEHGADVLKITATHIAARDDQEYDTGHGKLSARLDLRQSGDLDTLKGLVHEADVFSQGYRPEILGNRGLSPEELAKLRPGLVYVSLCAFSQRGRGRRAAASIRWCKTSAALLRAWASCSRVPSPGRNSTRSRRSTT
jgi:crotonobetainyl-CoA:carnitine CoA-transferase CaiB-like acyl-CoA transferase